MKTTKISLFATSIVLSILFSIYFNVNVNAQQETTKPTVENEYQVGAVLFHQKAAEYRALTYQAFNLAKMRLDMDKKLRKKLPKNERKKPRAIIVDADETVLDNSPYFSKLIKTKARFGIRSFFEWKKLAIAKAVPGSVEFLQYAKKKKVDIFYVSNVPGVFMDAVLDNLKKAGFPDATKDHVLLITKSSSKEPRRQKVAETHRVLMLIGDSLNDLSVAFERKSTAERFAEADKMRNEWGKKFIVIPNVIYGAWESAVYERQRLNDADKKVKRIESLEDY